MAHMPEQLAHVPTHQLVAVVRRMRTAIQLLHVDDEEARRIARLLPSGPRGIYLRMREEFLTLRPEAATGDAAFAALDYGRTLAAKEH